MSCFSCAYPGLKTGYHISEGNRNAAPFWATHQLLKEVTLYCSDESLKRLENIVLNYYTSWERGIHGRHRRGYAQLILLEALDPLRRSQITTRRLQEWKRKFISLGWLEPSGILNPPKQYRTIASVIGSPIPNNAANKMSDYQWLRAIDNYNQSGYNLSQNDNHHRLLGGASELAQCLEKQVKVDPKRFSTLLFKFPNNTNTTYFDAILRGLADAKIDLDTALSICKHLHKIPDHPCGRWMSHLIGQLAHSPWTQEAFSIVTWYALKDPNPGLDPENNSANDSLSMGFNSTRGSAVYTIAQLIFADKSRTLYFREALHQIIKDPSIGVRACAAEALMAVLNYDRNLAVQLFLQLCETADSLLSVHSTEQFLYYALSTHSQELSPILERMLNSDNSAVREVGARQACLYFLGREEAKSLAEHCLSGSNEQRKELAKIFSFNLRNGYQRDFCEQSLTQLFNDSEREVRSEAASCFAHFESSELGNHIDLVNKFIESNAFEDSQYQLLRALEKTTAKLPQIVIQVCERALDNKANNMNHGFDMTIMTKLLLRVYSQDSNQSLQSRCLDIVDRMTQIGVYDLDQALQVFER